MQEKRPAIPLPSREGLGDHQVLDTDTSMTEAAIRGINSYKRTRLLEDFQNMSLEDRKFDVVEEPRIRKTKLFQKEKERIRNKRRLARNYKKNELISKGQFEFECKVLHFLALTSSKHRGMF